MYAPLSDPARSPATGFDNGAGAPIGAPALAGEVQADVVVIGGGIAGCSVALHAAEAGTRVAVLEARTIGWGASGRNAGHVPPATKLPVGEVLRRFGPERGPRLIEASRAAPELVFGLAEKHGMNASVVRSGSLVAAHSPAALERLRRHVAELQARGHAIEMLDRARTAEVIGCDEDYYFGASLDRQGGTINPIAYVRGLARAARAAGATFHEASEADRLTRTDGKWRVDTARGRVVADIAVLCTNAYSGELWPGLRQTIVPVRAYQYLTRPLRDNIRRTILPGGQGMTDTRRLMSGIRIFPDGRLLFSGQGPPFGPEGTPFIERSAKRIMSLFGRIEQVEIGQCWTGWMAMNRENCWKLHELAPGLLAALGCNGRGLALATMLGRELARFIRGAPESDLLLPLSPLRPIPAHALHAPLVRTLIGYYRLRDSLEMRRPRKTTPRPRAA